MIRFLPCVADTYITNKAIVSSNASDLRSVNSNVGLAGTLDLFKLYEETRALGEGTGSIELSRVLLKFDYSPLQEMLSHSLNVTDSSFRTFLKLNDVFGGQPTPANFTLQVAPLAKPFTEGRGMDVVGFRDLDVANWLTASFAGGIYTAWASEGARASGSVGNTGVDYFVSGVINGTSSLLVCSQDFNMGSEDLSIDISVISKGILRSEIPNNGLVLSFSPQEETDSITRFAKRFFSRHSSKPLKHPRIEAHYDNSFVDQQLNAFFDRSNVVGFYRHVGNEDTNFEISGSPLTGSNCIRLHLVNSQSYSYWTSSFSPTHSQSINHLTASYRYVSASFLGSQQAFAGINQPGRYFASAEFDSTNAELLLNLKGSKAPNQLVFSTYWTSADGATFLASGSPVTMRLFSDSSSALPERNFVANLTNLKPQYGKHETTRLRLFMLDYDTNLINYQVPLDTKSKVFENVHWRLVHAYTREVVVDFDYEHNGTKLSADGLGMYFDLFLEDLPANQVYEIELNVRERGFDYLISNQGFRFKVA